MQKQAENPVLKLAVEIGPLAAFFLSFRWGRALADGGFGQAVLAPLTGPQALAGDSGPLFVATAIFMIATLAALAASWLMTRHLPRMALVTAALVAVFGGLTLWLQDETFIKMKPTILYGAFAFVLGVGLVQGRSYLKYLMGAAMPIDDAGWMIFTRRWVGFFVAMALLNEGVWRSQSTEIWVDFKTFAILPLTFAFLAFQLPLLKRHAVEEE